MATTITPGTTPIPYTYGGHTYWLMPDGHWANAKDGSGKVPQSAITAILAGQGVQQNGYGGTGTEPPGGTGSSAGPVWNPTPIPTSYQGGASYNGTIIIDPKTGARSYSIGYGDLRTPLGSGVTTTPTPTPTTGGTGTGTGGQSGGSTGGAGGSGSGSGGSAGGYGQGNPGNTGTGGDNPSAGYHGGNSGFGGMNGGSAVEHALAGHDGGAGSGGSGGSLFGNGYINLGKIGSGLLSAASLAAPFPYSVPFTLAQLAGRGYNTAETDSNREALGIPGLDTGQVIGSLLGWNNYGSLAGNQTIANKEQGVANPFGGGTSPVTTGGLYHDAYGPMDAFGSGEDTLAYTPAELSARREAAAGFDMGGAAGALMNGWGGVSGQARVNQIASGAYPRAAPGATPSMVTAPRPASPAPPGASPVAAALAGGIPITRADGTVIGFMNPDGTASNAAAQAALNSGAAGYGVGGKMATTAAMGGGWNGRSSNGGGIGSGTGISGGGQGERAGF